MRIYPSAKKNIVNYDKDHGSLVVDGDMSVTGASTITGSPVFTGQVLANGGVRSLGPVDVVGVQTQKMSMAQTSVLTTATSGTSNGISYTVAGATTTLTSFIPAGATVIGITAYVVAAPTGCTSWEMGVSGNTNLYLNAVPVTIGTRACSNVVAASAGGYGGDWAAPTLYTAAQSVILTALGGSTAWTAGSIRVTAHYIILTPSTS